MGTFEAAGGVFIVHHPEVSYYNISILEVVKFYSVVGATSETSGFSQYTDCHG